MSKDDIVVEELLNQREYYESLLLNADDNDKKKIEDILSINQIMIDYKKNRLALYSNEFTDFFLFDTVITLNTYFNANAYYLSSELLLHSLNNEVVDSYYTPIHEHVDSIIETDVFLKIVDGREVEGGSIFGYSSDRKLQDLCYSIHKFAYKKTLQQVRQLNYMTDMIMIEMIMAGNLLKELWLILWFKLRMQVLLSHLELNLNIQFLAVLKLFSAI